jgi:Calcineurin-like phosphoesterase
VLVAVGILAREPDRPEGAKWAANDTTFVCTGDLIDKGRQSLKVIALFRALEKNATEHGGRVVVTMGNHEAEFLADPEDDTKAEEFLRELDKADLDSSAIATGADADGSACPATNAWLSSIGTRRRRRPESPHVRRRWETS